MVLMEFPDKNHKIQASYQICCDTSFMSGPYETFLSPQAWLTFARYDFRTNLIIERGNSELLEKQRETVNESLIKVFSHPTDPRVAPIPIIEYDENFPKQMRVPWHQPHIANFFDTMRGRAKLSCPGHQAYKTTVLALEINEYLEKNRKNEI